MKNNKKSPSKISNFFENLIIIPVTKIVSKTSKIADKIGKKTEQWLIKKKTILFVSLFLAIIMFIFIDQKILNFTGSSAEVLKNQKVSVIYNEEAYVAEGIPETVDITLIGRTSDLYFAKQSPAHNVNIDLSDLKPGTHRVKLKYIPPLASLDYQVNPGEVTVVIKNKISATKTLTIDVINQDKLDKKLVIKKVKIDNDQVIIKGSEDTLARVSSVKALVDINKIGKQEIGTVTIKDVELKAYDENGEVIKVEIVPGKVNAEVEIESPSKELPIKVIPKGSLAFGYAISSIKTNETKVLVYGDAKVLDALKYIPVEIDVTGLKLQKEYKLELIKPTGINSMSVNNVTVEINVDKSLDKEIENINIQHENLSDGYSVQGVSASDISITVVLKGVSTVVDSITPEDVNAYVDLKDLKEGEHEVEVKVIGNDLRIQYIPKVKKVKVVIRKK